MKKIKLIGCLVLLPYFTAAQHTISGKVTDAETGKTISSAHIRLIDTKNVGAITSSDGSFSMKANINTSGLIATHISYQADTVYFTIPSEKIANDEPIEINFKLFPYVSRTAPEVVITASRADYKSAMVYTDIRAEEIEAINTGRDIPYLLESIPSITSTSDAGNGIGYTALRIRGSDATRINVTVDGIPINDPESHLLYWVNMPDLASSVDQIQVQRGAGTSSNGASSFGGGIHITTNRPPNDAYGAISLAGGSFNTLKSTFRAGTGLISGKWNFEARLSKITSDGYVDRASTDLKSFFVSGGFYGKKHSVRMNVFSGKEITYQSWYGIPEAALDTNRTWNYYTYDNQVDNYQQDHYQLFHSWQITDNISWNSALHFTYGRGYYEEFKEDEFLADYLLNEVVIGSDTISQTDLIRRKWLDNDFYGITSNLSIKPNDKLNIQLGGAYNEYDGNHFGEVIWAQFASNGNIRYRFYDNNGFKTDFNGFSKVAWDISEKVSLYADLQVRRIQYKFTGYDEQLMTVPQNDELTFFNPKGGLTYRTGPGRFGYVSFSSATKEPSRDDYTESSVNSRPKPERLLDLESGYHHSWRNLVFQANYFMMLYKDQLVLTGQINDVGNYTRTNVPDSYREGIEIEFKYRPSDKINITGNATFSRHKIKEFREFIDDYDLGGQQLTIYRETDIAFSPNFTAFSAINYMPHQHLSIRLTGRHTGKQYLDNTSNDKKSLDAFTVSDLMLLLDPQIKKIKGLSLSLHCFNLFDIKYESNGYTFGYIAGGGRVDENYYYPQAGRNFMVKADFTF
ncbi:MAG: TonB-dependent receptor [Bacteroidota bacterium]